MESNIPISIIIPLYNKEQYFERCFNSVAAQTYANIECFIIDDCSTDNSATQAEQLIRNYKGFIQFNLIKHIQNGGLSASRNTGIENAKGEYLFFLDADDEITPNCVNVLVALVEKYPGVDMVQGNRITRIVEEGDILKTKQGELPEFVKDNLTIKKKYSRFIPSTSWNKLVNKKFVLDNNLFFKKGIIHEDTHWKLLFLKKIETFAFSNEVTYIFYKVPDSIMSNKNLYPSISSRLIIAEEILNNLDIDLFDEQLIMARDLLHEQKKRITSDIKYSSLMPKYAFLLKKMPKSIFFVFLPARVLAKRLKIQLHLVLLNFFGERRVERIKSTIRR